MIGVLRSLWREPRAADPPARVWRDWALVAVLVPTAVLEATLRPDLVWPGVSLVVGLIIFSALLWRRTHPLATVLLAFGSVAAVQVASTIADVEWEGLYSAAAILLLPYSLFRWGSGREAAVGASFVLLTPILSVFDAAATVGDLIGGIVILLLACAVGALTRYEVNLRSREIDQVKLLEREQLARELHDTVAHHVSAIAVQAQAGRTLAGSDPDAAVRALHVIENEASRTLGEMRSMVGALRRGDDAELEPQRGVTDIRRLAVDGDVSAPPVTVELRGDLAGLRPAVDSAIYRLAQESITNARRHARQASAIEVTVEGDTDSVELTVLDDGEPTTFDPTNTTGFGLVGMAERAKLLGGTFAAGPCPGRGWKTSAALPRSAVER